MESKVAAEKIYLKNIILAIYYLTFFITTALWIGASGNATYAGNFIWDSTGLPMFLSGYLGWYQGSTTCAFYNITIPTLPAWAESACTAKYGGICERQPQA